MATVSVGIVVSARDAASSALGKIGAGFASLRQGINAVAERGKAMFATLGRAMQGVNAGLEIAKKGLELFRQTIGAAVESALQQRAATDLQRKAWEEYARQVEVTKGLLGDIFLPILLGIADGFSRASGAADNYLEKNRQIIATGIVEHMANLSRILLNVMAPALLWVSRLALGFRLAWSLVTQAVNVLFEGFERGIAAMLGGIARLHEFLGNEGLAKDARETQREVEKLADTFGASGDEAVASAARAIKEHEDLAAQIADAQVMLEKVIAESRAASLERIAQATKKVAVNQEELDKLAAQRSALIMKIIELRGKQIDATWAAAEAEEAAESQTIMRSLQARELAAQRIAEVEQFKRDQSIATQTMIADNEERAAAVVAEKASAMQAAFSAVGNSIVSAIRSAESFGDAMLAIGDTILGVITSMLVEWLAAEAAKQVAAWTTATSVGAAAATGATAQVAASTTAAGASIAASTASGAAAAISAHAGIPFVGLALGVLAAAGIIAAIASVAGGFGGGGRSAARPNVSGSIGPGKAHQMEPPRTGSSSSGLSSGGGGGGVNVFNLQVPGPPSQTDFMRYHRQTVQPLQRRLARNGL